MMAANTIQSFTKSSATKPKRHADAPALVWTWWYAGAICGLTGGLLATIFGVLLNAISWVAGQKAAVSLDGQIGTWLIIATIPLMMFGAHCLDKADSVSKTKRVNYCRQHGMSDGDCPEA